MRRSPTDWPPNSFRITLTVLVLFGAVVIVIAGSIFVAAVAMATGQVTVADFQQRPPRIPADFQIWSQYALYLPLAAYFLLVIGPVSKLSFRELGFHTFSLRTLAVAVLGAIIMWLVVATASGLIEQLTHLHDTEAAVLLMQNVRSPLQKAGFILMAVAFAPLVEELTFRAFLFNAFLRWMPFAAAALLSGVLFGAVHAQSLTQMVTAGIPLALGGVVLAAVYYRTRSYWGSVLTHGLFNSVSVIAHFAFHVKA